MVLYVGAYDAIITQREREREWERESGRELNLIIT
jgi:hypothetical protein